MTVPLSITSADSFRFRAQRSEHGRLLVMLGVWILLLVQAVVRRMLGGELMSTNRLFLPLLIVAIVLIIHESVMLVLVGRANRQSRLLYEWRWRVNAIVELAGPLTLLTILHLHPPSAEINPLTSPIILVFPIVIMMSILRLRPKFTLWTGVAAGMIHLLLTIHAVVTRNPPATTVPMMLSYSFMLMITGVAAAIVSQKAKTYVRETVEEATAAESARQRVELMQRDLSIARDIQRGLLPTVAPSLKHFDIAGFSRPADETGGDYYDWQTLPDGRVAVVLADVTGHGIGPALVMAVCRAYARASAPVVPEPGALLHRLNNLIHADIGQGRFITLAVALLDDGSSNLQLLSAGHGPILLYRAETKSIVRYNGDGFPLGIVPDGDFGQAHSLRMNAGDALLMLTDGFFEWQRPSDRKAVGIERIETLFAQHADESSESVLREIDAAVCEFCKGAQQTDDMTAVVIKRI